MSPFSFTERPLTCRNGDEGRSDIFGFGSENGIEAAVAESWEPNGKVSSAWALSMPEKGKINSAHFPANSVRPRHVYGL
jgi:hypothetical protein